MNPVTVSNSIPGLILCKEQQSSCYLLLEANPGKAKEHKPLQLNIKQW